MASDPVFLMVPAYDQITFHQAPSNQDAFGWLGFNRAAWLINSGEDLQVGFASFTAPSAHQIIVRNGAVAVNPVEWTKQILGRKMFPWIECPFVLGNDCAGEVVQVGSMVTHFRVGDRVLAHALSMDQAVNHSSEGAFQNYIVIRENMAAVIPRWLSYEEACVIPLGLSTAATALFGQDFLSLHHPGIPRGTGPDWLPEAVLVWDGSTSIGSSAIQLATAAGYEVITTCAPGNFEYVTRLGASAVFDHRDPLTIQQIVDRMQQKKVVGAVAIGNDSAEACIEVLRRTEGAAPGYGSLGLVEHQGLAEVEEVWGEDQVGHRHLCGPYEVGAMVYNHFLPGALATGAFVAAPKPLVVGKGLEQIQTALNCHMRGVTAQKAVVSL
ncbi:hypothetical protein VN97_g9392 [Penicillium thymicola]|uniref:Enoyl reductase (ER) domain-containing protein n=1 Tax=Penicillium thymicola TaxID=293382 RepID=A0AAI9X532_PENTH|nr:hypothetical protein VN97_g9392 [Penicillium thymicola]